MWAFLQSDQTIKDVLPACGPWHHPVHIWNCALQQLAVRGCAGLHVWLRCALMSSWGAVLTTGCCLRKKGKVFFKCVKYLPGLSLLWGKGNRVRKDERFQLPCFLLTLVKLRKKRNLLANCRICTWKQLLYKPDSLHLLTLLPTPEGSPFI